MDYLQKYASPPPTDPALRIGHQIVVIGGKYEKCYGFMDLSKGKNGKTLFYAYVLLVDSNDEYHAVRLSKLNVKQRNHDYSPSTVFQASLLQVPKLEKKFVSLARDVATIWNMHKKTDESINEAAVHFRQILIEQFQDVKSSNGKKWTVVDESKIINAHPHPDAMSP